MEKTNVSDKEKQQRLFLPLGMEILSIFCIPILSLQCDRGNFKSLI